ncbi:MAG: ribosome assembly RNA-binding protein YhbY [Mariprofundaceae bacterium]|nr:ribosome assembly RNA-binding protein YhbY [Mariprofundaceae bacterium]
MSLNTKERSALKSRAHHLKPVIRIGQHGVSDNVISETDNALTTHELIKVHIQHDEREIRLQYANTLAEKNHAELVHKIGKIFILYRKNIET